MIYHYCNGSVFEKIITTKEIWLSDITKMNDESEFKSGYEIIRDVLSEFGLNDHDIVNEMSDKNLNKTFQILIGCFSGAGDLKSNWLEYAEHGTGISIGFDPEEIKQFNLFNRVIENNFNPISSTVNFIKINYDENQLRRYAQHFIESYIKSESTMKWLLLSRLLMHLSISYKDRFFEQENETRAVVTLELNIDDRYKIEQRETKYGDANFHRLNTSYDKFQSIKEVIVGPKSTLTLTDVKSMLVNSGLEEVLVKQSTATGKYR